MAASAAVAAAALPEWLELPLDVLQTIIGSLEMLPDALAAAAVCTPWRAAAAAVLGPALTPRRLPWLVTVPSGGGESSDAKIYDVFNGNSRLTTLPGVDIAHGWEILGSSRGWLFVIHGRDRRRLSFFSPFTGAHISLPPRPRGIMPKKAVLSTASPGSYLVLLIPDHCEGVFFLTVAGDGEWRRIKWCSSHLLVITDCIFHNSRFLTVDDEGSIMQWGVDSEPEMIFQGYYGRSRFSFFLVAAPWGDLLLVKHRRYYNESRRMQAEFSVFIVHQEVYQEVLESTDDLHGHTMIVDAKHCSLVSAECHHALPADVVMFFYTGFRFSVDDVPSRGSNRVQWEAGVYNLKSKTCLPVPPSLQPPNESSYMHSIWSYPPHLVVSDSTRA